MRSIFQISFVWLAAISVSVFGCAQETGSNITVKFELHAPELVNETKVFIAGSLPSLGNWNPGKVEMKSLGDHRWSFETRSKANYPIEYKYTLGSWAKEGADADGRALPNFAIQPKLTSTIKDEVVFWTSGESKEVVGQITGTVKYHRQLKSEGLLPRDVIVWLPPGYDESTDRYPVLYMHDGQNIVDPKTSSFGVDWQIDETLTELIKLKKVKPMIVVGIYNTPERVKDYLPGDQGAEYASFVCHTLKPLIDKTYRTDPSRESTAVAGSSAGGTCAFTMAWNNPDVFSKAICVSPSFQYKRPNGTMAVNYVPEFAASKLPANPPLVYLDNGGVGLELILQPGIDALLKEMKNKGLQEGKDFYWKHFPEARHEEAAWAKRLPGLLEMLFPRD